MEHDNGGSRAIKVSSRKYKNYISLAVIVAGAFLLRVYGLGSLPYNYDEPKNIEIIDAIDLATLSLPARSFQHPPVSVYVLNVGTALFGANPFGYRFMNAVVGALSALVIYRLARDGFGDARVGLLAALFLATNRFHIGWSRLINQEVIYLALVASCLVAFWRLRRREAPWFILAALLGLAMLTKELAVLLPPALLVYMLTSAEGRRSLKRKETWLVAASFALVAVALLAYALGHPQRDEMNLGVNLYRAQSVGISVEPVEFFVGPSTTHDAPLEDAWTYPSMFWPTGALLLIGVACSIRGWRDDFVRLMLVVFASYFAVFTFVGTDMSRIPFHQGEYWWVDVALIPGIVLASHVLIRIRERGAALRTAFWAVPVYLVVNALFFVAVTKNGPILAWAGLTYDDVVARVPFLF